MKKITFISLLVGSVALGPMTAKCAAPVAEGNESLGYMLKARDLRAWSAGGYLESHSRDVDATRARNAELKTQRAMAYVSYAPIRWASVYASGGIGRYKLSPFFGDYSDEQFQWGGGLRLNLLDHDVLDPTLFEDRIRLNAGVHYGRSQGRLAGVDHDWNELTASLTVSMVNDVVGNKAFLPYSISIFGGPLYSMIDGRDIESKDEFGLVAGMQVHLTHKVTLTTSIEYIDEASVVAGFDVRF